jgi:AcrR family transcriptional regulator
MDGNSPKTGRDSRRQAILEVAREAFLAEGYAAVSMSAIAATLGGSKATLYAYFRSKAELFAAVMEDLRERNSEALFETGFEEPGSVDASLRRLGRRFLRLILSEDMLTIHRLAAAESIRFPEVGQALYVAGPKKGVVRMAAYLEGHMAAGRLRQVDPVMAGQQLISMCMGEPYRRRLWNVGPAPTEAEINAVVDAAVDTFMAAFGTEKA